MVLGTRDNPPYQGNFIEHLYEKKFVVPVSRAKVDPT